MFSDSLWKVPLLLCSSQFIRYKNKEPIAIYIKYMYLIFKKSSKSRFSVDFPHFQIAMCTKQLSSTSHIWLLSHLFAIYVSENDSLFSGGSIANPPQAEPSLLLLGFYPLPQGPLRLPLATSMSTSWKVQRKFWSFLLLKLVVLSASAFLQNIFLVPSIW